MKMLDSKSNLNDKEAMINPIHSAPVDNVQLQNNQTNSNSNVNISTENCGNSNQQIKPQYHIICAQNLDQTLNNNLSQSFAMHGDSVNSNMATLLIGQDCFLDNEEHLNTDTEVTANVNEVNLHLDSNEPPVLTVECITNGTNLHLDNNESLSVEAGAIANEINKQTNSGLFDAQDTEFHVLEKNKEIPTTQCVTTCSDDLIEPFQSQLHIDIGPDDSTHSWRPTLNDSEPDCSFFLPSKLPNCNTNTDNINVLKTIEEVDSQSSLEAYWEEASQDYFQSKSQMQLPVLFLNDGSDMGRSIDLQSQLRCQRVQVNSLKYELERTKLEYHRLRDKISDFETKLNESFISIHKIVLLREDNAKLGSECQFLSNQVDYYSKERVPLGEVDEDFYKAHNLFQLHKQAKYVPVSGKSENAVTAVAQHQPIQETDATNTWNCPECTFANHPEINSCEICQTQRQKTGNGRHCISSNTPCYCHSNEETSPIFS